MSVEDQVTTSVDSKSAVNNKVDGEAVTRSHKYTCTYCYRSIELWLKSNRRSAVEAVILSCAILVAWCLFSIPTVFYALPQPRVRYA